MLFEHPCEAEKPSFLGIPFCTLMVKEVKVLKFALQALQWLSKAETVLFHFVH
jgi:hypothetical protein